MRPDERGGKKKPGKSRAFFQRVIISSGYLDAQGPSHVLNLASKTDISKPDPISSSLNLPQRYGGDITLDKSKPICSWKQHKNIVYILLLHLFP
jgi:hypothetical protein